MGDAGGQLADRRELLRLQKPLVEAPHVLVLPPEALHDRGREVGRTQQREPQRHRHGRKVAGAAPLDEAEIGVRHDPQVLQQRHRQEEHRRQRRDQVADARRQQDRRDDDVEHVEERERVLDPPRYVQGERQHGEIHHDLPPGEGQRRHAAPREAREDDVEPPQEARQAQQVRPRDGELHRCHDRRREHDAGNREPAQPDEPADPFGEFRRGRHARSLGWPAEKEKGRRVDRRP